MDWTFQIDPFGPGTGRALWSMCIVLLLTELFEHFSTSSCQGLPKHECCHSRYLKAVHEGMVSIAHQVLLAPGPGRPRRICF